MRKSKRIWKIYFHRYDYGQFINILSLCYYELKNMIEEHEGNNFDDWWLLYVG